MHLLVMVASFYDLFAAVMQVDWAKLCKILICLFCLRSVWKSSWPVLETWRCIIVSYKGASACFADMWKQVVGAPNMDGFVRKPDILSFCIASKLPVSVSTRQELLEINGVSCRLRREIKLLEGFDRVRCKNCQVLLNSSPFLIFSSFSFFLGGKN